MSAPHDPPDASQLIELAREFLDSSPEPGARTKFLTRVADNALAIAAREIELGPAQALAHTDRLASLGFASDASLADAIRTGALDTRYEEVASAVRATIRDKLLVANPEHLH